MPTHVLAHFQADVSAERSLAPVDRVIYVVAGDVDVASDAGATTLATNQAWLGAGACTIRPRRDARVWLWELRPGADAPAGAILARAIDLPAADCLMRCDRVDFPLGGVAYTHTHQGPGIRVLLRGRFRVEVDGHEQRIAPGEAWFEAGPDPVYAEASREELTSFIRVMVLPHALLGKSSIRYVKPEDQARPKTQTYTVFVDRPIAS